ncbi:MAG: hypothetical protein AAF481_07220 [Acidobacteriota bacterium]
MADDSSLLERLAQESRSAALAARSALPDPQGSPKPGAIWALASVDSFFVLIQRDPVDADRFLAVPADHRRQVGSRDVPCPPTEGQAPLVLRCAVPLWLDRRQLSEGQGVGQIDDIRRGQALEVLHGADSEHPERLDIDEETAYRDWIREGPDADRERLLARARRRTRLPLAAALAGLVALGAWVVSLQLRSDPTTEIALTDTGPEILIGDNLRGIGDFPLPRQSLWHVTLYWSADAPTFPTYRVELVDASGQRVAQIEIPDENPQNTGVSFPTEDLRPGFHKLRVLGVKGNEEELLTEHSFRFGMPRGP